MGQLLLKDNAASTLSVSLSAVAGSGQTVTIAGSGAKFPTVTGTDWSFLTIFDGAGNIESMRVTAHAPGSNSFTVSRGTSAGITGMTDADVKAWAAGTSTGVACRPIAQIVQDINNVAASAAADAASAAANAASAAAALGNLGPTIHAATSKATPVDADEFGIWDSVSGLLGKVTWANLKATAKTYFNTLYAKVGEIGSSGVTMSTGKLLGRVSASTGAVEELSGDQVLSLASAVGFRNKIINGGFAINQRAYVSGAAVGAGLYGHDRWKMAASADTYTFSTTNNKTTVTIPAGKVLQQVIEGLNLQTGTYVLSWEGTAQGKIGAGSYGTSGITGSITGGTNTTIEFGPGTVANIQLESGSVATPFEQRAYGMELALCQRYYETAGFAGFNYFGGAGPGWNVLSYPFKAEKRVTPTVVFSGMGYASCSTIVTGVVNTAQLNATVTATEVGGGSAYGTFTASAEL